jgi:hypothetical protein
MVKFNAVPCRAGDGAVTMQSVLDTEADAIRCSCLRQCRLPPEPCGILMANQASSDDGVFRCRGTLSSLPRESGSMAADANVIAEDSTVLRSDTVSCEVTVILVRPDSGIAATANGAASSLQQLEV